MGFSILLLIGLLIVGYDLNSYYSEGDTSTRESILGNYSKAAVASDGAGPICATIGK